jgi:hypothetical protein
MKCKYILFVCITTCKIFLMLGYELEDRGFDYSQGLGIFLYTTASRPALGLTQPPIQWVPGALSLGVKLITSLHLVPRSRMRGAIPPAPNTPSSCDAQFKKRKNK